MMFAVLVLLAGAPQTEDVLAPARAGKLQCYQPNVAARTCQSLASYTRNPDGSYRNGATVLISPTAQIVLETSSVVHVVSGAVCGTIARDDVLAGKVFKAGAPIAPDKMLLESIADGYAAAGLIGPEICTRYIADGAAMKAEISIAGVPQPDFSTRVIWVSPDDGYRVAG